MTMTAKPAAVRWDALAEHISAHIDGDQQSRMRIGVFTAPLRIAVAAAVLLAVGVGTWLGVRGPGDPIQPTSDPVLAKVDIQGPTVETASGASVAEIEIGPSPTFTESDDSNDWFAESRPQRAILFSGVASERQDDRPY